MNRNAFAMAARLFDKSQPAIDPDNLPVRTAIVRTTRTPCLRTVPVLVKPKTGRLTTRSIIVKGRR